MTFPHVKQRTGIIMASCFSQMFVEDEVDKVLQARDCLQRRAGI
jgi:hypothetical protein